MRRWRVGCAGVVASVLAVSACGGPTDASVIAQGNVICERTLAAIRVEPDTQAGLSAAGRIVAEEVRGLRALPRPAEHLRVLTRFLRAEETVSRAYSALAAAERVGAGPAAARAGSALGVAAESAARAAQSYGLSRCAAAGPTVGS